MADNPLGKYMNNGSTNPLSKYMKEEVVEKPEVKTLTPFYQKVGVETGRSNLPAIIRSTIAGTGRDIEIPVASFINQFALNAPRSLAKKAGLEYPEERMITSPIAKALSYGAGAVGGMKNPLISSISKAPSLGLQALRGATAGAAYSPEDFTDIGSRALQATVGGTLPFAGRGISKVGKALGNITKTGRDYLYTKVAQPAAEKIRTALRNIPEVAERFGLKNETVEALKKYGYETASNPEALEEAASQAFNNAVNQKTKVYGNKINVKDTLGKVQELFSELKGTDRRQVGVILQRLRELQPAKEGFYKNKLPTPTQLTRQFKGENLIDIAEEARITRTAFSNLRKEISDLYGKGDYDNKILGIIDTLYNDAEKSGLKGMQQARKLFSQYKEVAKVSKDLAKIEKIDATKLHTDLLSISKEPKKYQSLVDKYTKFLGKEETEKLFKEALDVKSGETAKRVLGRIGWIGGPAAAGALIYGSRRR